MENRICTRCKNPKPLLDFGRNAAHADGLSRICKVCEKVHNQTQYAKHVEKRRAYAATYAASHPEERALAQKEWIAKNKDKLKAYQKEYRKTHTTVRPEGYNAARAAYQKEKYHTDPEYRESVKAESKAYRQANPDKTRDAMRQWVNINRDAVRAYHRNYVISPEAKIRYATYNKEWREKNADRVAATRATYRARREYDQGVITTEHIAHLWVWQQGRCWHCGIAMQKAGKGTPMAASIEHILPLDREGTNGSENVVLACRSCNFSKQDRTILEWAPASTALPSSLPLACRRTGELAASLTGAAYAGLDVWEAGQSRFMVLSSFTLSSPNADIRRLDLVRAANPDVALTWDFDWTDSPLHMMDGVLGKHDLPPWSGGFISPAGYEPENTGHHGCRALPVPNIQTHAILPPPNLQDRPAPCTSAPSFAAPPPFTTTGPAPAGSAVPSMA